MTEGTNKKKYVELFKAIFPKSIMNDQNDSSDIFDKFRRLYGQFDRLSEQINDRWSLILNWEYLLANAETGENTPSLIEKGKRKGLMNLYNKRWIAFGLAYDLYRILNTDSVRFSSEKQQYLSRIRNLDPELAQKITPIVMQGSGSLGILGPIRGIIGNQQLVVSYVKTHYEDLMSQIDRMEDKKTADRLRKTIVLLSGREIEELNDRCISDVRSWTNRAVYGIPLFIERGFLFINGGRSRYDREVFLGFKMHFRDEELVNEMKRTPEIRRLLTYQIEIEFFNRMSSAIRESVRTQGKWEGFYNFYDNLDKGENYIKVVRENYGNEKFAKLLEAFKEQKHEAPVDWATELAELSHTLMSRAYQLVVEPAAQALIRIFDARIRKLGQERAAAFVELQKLIAERDPSSKARRAFADLLAKKRKKLRKEIENERREFENLMQPVILAMPDIESKIGQLDQMTEDTNELRASNEVMYMLSDWRRFVAGNLKTIGRADEMLDDSVISEITRSTLGNYKSIKLAVRNKKIRDMVGVKYDEGIKILQRVIETNNSIMIPAIEKCVSYINSRYVDYVNEINNFLNQKLEQKVLQLRVQPNNIDIKTPVQKAA